MGEVALRAGREGDLEVAESSRPQGQVAAVEAARSVAAVADVDSAEAASAEVAAAGTTTGWPGGRKVRAQMRMGAVVTAATTAAVTEKSTA